MYCDKCECTFEDKGLNKVRHRTGRCSADPDRVHAAVEKANEVVEPIDLTNDTFYVVEYATVATYYKVKANTYEEAENKVYEDGLDGIESMDRHEVQLEETTKGMYEHTEDRLASRIK